MELVKRSRKRKPPGAHGRNQGLADFVRLLCFPSRRFSSQDRRPQNGSASTGKLHYSNVRCGNRSNLIASASDLLVVLPCEPQPAPRLTRRMPFVVSSLLCQTFPGSLRRPPHPPSPFSRF